jgi:thiol:disulfide interchange protein
VHKLLALVTVAILASSVIAADGGINEDTNLTETDFESMEYSNVVFEEQEFTISLTLKNESTNISQINWITQVCINSGVCYPPKTIEMKHGLHQ